MSSPAASDPSNNERNAHAIKVDGVDFLKYQQQRDREYKWQFAGVLVDLVESQILTVDEARAVLGYDPKPQVTASFWTSTGQTSIPDNPAYRTGTGGSK